MSYFHENDDYELAAEAREQRRALRGSRHWCSTCLGHTGPGSPCAPDEPEEEEDDSPYCGCNAEPTVSELEDGRCDACGKEIA